MVEKMSLRVLKGQIEAQRAKLEANGIKNPKKYLFGKGDIAKMSPEEVYLERLEQELKKREK